jgi:hypothetical protein
MNREESNLFAMELTIAFPEFRAIAEKSSPNYEATKQSWALAWLDLSLEECRTSLKRLIVDGEISYEEYRAPGPFIRRLVLATRNRVKPSEAEQVDGKRKSRSDYKGSPMAAALAAVNKAKLEGKSEQECLAMIDAAFPPSNPYDQPRYKCQHCQDRGLVPVWRTDSDFSDIGKLHRGHTYNVACYCEAGTLINQPAKEKFRLPVYTPERYCKFASVDIETDRETLRRFLSDKSKPAVWNPGEMELV